MRLCDGDDPTETWQYAERFLGGGTRTYSRFSADLDISRAYHPQWGQERFCLPTFQVPQTAGVFFRNEIDSRLPDRYQGAGWFLLPVHPDTLSTSDLPGRTLLLASPQGPCLEVSPTANARTVLVHRIAGEAVEPHFVKLHYPRRLSRFSRRLRRPMIELQLWVATELHRAKVAYLPEVAGGAYGEDPEQAWGFLLRQRQLVGGSLRYTVPLFALYGTDVHAPDDPTLLEQLVERSGLAASALVTQRLVAPLVELWWQILRTTGCLAEPHGQNALVTFDGDQVQVGYRDCGIYVDAVVRQERGLPTGLPPRNVIPGHVDKPAAQVRSLVYDTFLGHHALSYLARVAHERLGVAPRLLHHAARAAFHEAADPRLAWPATVYNYDDRLYPDGAWALVDTGDPPRWR